MSAAEKAAALILILGKDASTGVLAHFGKSELQQLARAMARLGRVPASALNDLVAEFEQHYKRGADLVGSLDQTQNLLSGALAPEEVATIIASIDEQPAVPVWNRIGQVGDAELAKYLAIERPQVTAFILARTEAALAAKILAQFDVERRNAVMRRMVRFSPVSEAVVRLLGGALDEDVVTKRKDPTAPEPEQRVAAIINKLEHQQVASFLEQLEVDAPSTLAKIKEKLFKFEDVARLSMKARMVLLDKVPSEKVILALKGTTLEFRDAVLSALASRARRIVEAELESGGPAAAKEVAEARQSIAEVAALLGERGEIELGSGEPEPMVA